MKYKTQEELYSDFKDYINANYTKEEAIYAVCFDYVQFCDNGEVVEDFLLGNEIQNEILKHSISNYNFVSLVDLNNFLQFFYYKKLLKSAIDA